ncbi:HAD family hydrolase [Clostridium weizhouense]|uniref:HAD family phosphatase n=1 Tax=Clostridium weizhouense TaxID=2859781 RepID=A0ABS7APQ8_9CLOT|nr:HAD family phosphatase [Clostridium weizhouense]MBW6410645.1 HAD family phosphatase [Clostridium weizhouense]
MNKQYTKAIIFDMDGVIVDSERIYFGIERDVFSHFKIKISKEEHEGFVGSSLENMWDKIIKDKSLKICPKDTVNYHKQYVMKHMEGLELVPIKNVKEFINDIKEKNIKIALASSSTKALINLILNKLEIRNLFDVIVSGEEVKQSKPNPEIFLKAAKFLNVDPSDCIVIEDSSNGVRAAKKAGMKCIGFLNPGSGNQCLEEADIIISEFPKNYFDIQKDIM